MSLFFLLSGCLLTRQDVEQEKLHSKNHTVTRTAQKSHTAQKPHEHSHSKMRGKKIAATAATDLAIQLSQITEDLRNLRGQVEMLDKKQQDQSLVIQNLILYSANFQSQSQELSSSQTEKRDPLSQAELFFRKKKYKQAIVHYEQYRKTHHKKSGVPYRKATVQIGICFQRLGLNSEADVFFREIIELAPHSSEAQKARRHLSKRDLR